LELHDFLEYRDFVDPIFLRNGIDFVMVWEGSGLVKIDRLLRRSLHVAGRERMVVGMH
jgi:hypothetical protein